MTETRAPIEVLMRWGWAMRDDGLCSRCKVRPHKAATEEKPSESCICHECHVELAAEFWAIYDEVHN